MGLWQSCRSLWHMLVHGRGSAESKQEEVPNLLDEPPVWVGLHSGMLPLTRPVRVIALYLPQFHAIPENDRWWGEGFTEWTNVRAAVPQFEGHYQPHVPGELGYYNLLSPGVQARQIELARLYGIEGFCFYFYWFAGKRLLERPLENWLNDPSLDLPSCLCWANENWTRRWDGHDSEVLIAQSHSPDDDMEFIAAVAPYLRDPRYIRVGGKPLLIVYRPNLLPDMASTASRWRKWCRENGIGELYLACTQSFEEADPFQYGLDASIEFPPVRPPAPKVTENIVPIAPDFQMNILNWRAFLKRSEAYPPTRYPLHRSVCTSWDNTARRKSAGTLFANSSPDGFRKWLTNAMRDTLLRFADRSSRIIFVNAWNEWAEGAHLEPDQRFGYAWLQAVRDALERVEGEARRSIILVGHDAHPHGAQYVLLHFAEAAKALGMSVHVLLLGDGSLRSRYAACAKVHVVDPSIPASDMEDLLHGLVAGGASLAVVNTAVSGSVIPGLKSAGARVVSLVHELPGLLRAYQLEEPARSIAAHADTVVFPASAVQAGFEQFVKQELAQGVIRPQGHYHAGFAWNSELRTRARSAIRMRHGLAQHCNIILSVGYGDRRKGLDLFVEASVRVLAEDPNAVAIWVGHAEPDLLAQVRTGIAASGFERRIVFAGFVENPVQYYAAADVYALSSREDPFPSVVMEALSAELPVVAFAGAGGIGELLSRDCGVLVPLGDCAAMGSAVTYLLANPAEAARLGVNGRRIVAEEFGFRDYVWDILKLGGLVLPKVSVIVPNFNYARYLSARLASIEGQTIVPYEIIILDDASSDNSLQVIEAFRKRSVIPLTLVTGSENSGSVFGQWEKGVSLAKGDFVWIAEADDTCDPGFLAALLPAFGRPEVVMSYCESRQIDENGRPLAENYLQYVSDLDEWHWRRSFVAEGRAEIVSSLYVKNTIPNVSAVVFRRETLRETFRVHGDEIRRCRYSGDWVTYLRLLETGSVSFLSEALNVHRRHSGSVTAAGLALLQEIVRVQRDTIRRFGLGDRQKEVAERYAQELFEQFGLVTEGSPRFAQHPALQLAE